ncbi:hypothetical protein Hanom_Chr01g00025561 [Helianthus anomalus]
MRFLGNIRLDTGSCSLNTGACPAKFRPTRGVSAEHGAVLSRLFSMAKKFTRFNANELDAKARYGVLRTRPEEYPRQVCMDFLETVN